MISSQALLKVYNFINNARKGVVGERGGGVKELGKIFFALTPRKGNRP